MATAGQDDGLRALEDRLGLRLLTRTTRSVAPSEAGERLLGAIGPHFDGIEAELAALSELRDKPAGALRTTTGIHAAIVENNSKVHADYAP